MINIDYFIPIKIELLRNIFHETRFVLTFYVIFIRYIFKTFCYCNNINNRTVQLSLGILVDPLCPLQQYDRRVLRCSVGG